MSPPEVQRWDPSSSPAFPGHPHPPVEYRRPQHEYQERSSAEMHQSYHNGHTYTLSGEATPHINPRSQSYHTEERSILVQTPDLFSHEDAEDCIGSEQQVEEDFFAMVGVEEQAQSIHTATPDRGTPVSSIVSQSVYEDLEGRTSTTMASF